MSSSTSGNAHTEQNIVKTLINTLQRDRLIAIIRTDSADTARWLAEVYVSSGVRWIEITWNTPNAYDVLKSLSASFPEVYWGAGTILSPEAVNEAIDAGAKYLISPVFLPSVVTETRKHADVLSIPSAATPTEMYQAYEAGAHLVKIFPAKALGGPGFIRAVRAPLPHIPVIATGDIEPTEATDYLRAGATAVGIGSALAGSTACILHRDWDAVANSARKVAEVCRR